MFSHGASNSETLIHIQAQPFVGEGCKTHCCRSFSRGNVSFDRTAYQKGQELSPSWQANKPPEPELNFPKRKIKHSDRGPSKWLPGPRHNTDISVLMAHGHSALPLNPSKRSVALDPSQTKSWQFFVVFVPPSPRAGKNQIRPQPIKQLWTRAGVYLEQLVKINLSLRASWLNDAYKSIKYILSSLEWLYTLKHQNYTLTTINHRFWIKKSFQPLSGLGG